VFSNEFIYHFTQIGVFCCWIGFAAVFFLSRRPHASKERKRDRRAVLGVLIAMVGYAIVWSVRRKEFLLLPQAGTAVGALLSLVALILALSSVWLTGAAVRHLGKQWAVAARVLEQHELITDGPYAIVRNPIYTGMLGMLIATGLALSEWWAIILGVVVYLIGTTIRIRVEEKLLKDAFGEKFEAYARTVSAIIPRVSPQKRG